VLLYWYKDLLGLGRSMVLAQGRRRIGTTGYRGRIAGVAARGLVVLV